MIPRLHVVTNDEILAREDFLARANEVLEAGSDLVLHLRGPGTGARRLSELAVAVREQAEKTGAKVLVNDRIDVALCSGLDGAHLGGRSLAPHAARALLGADRLVGVSVHSIDEGREAERDGADFLFVGSIWATASHPERAPSGLQLMRGVSDAVTVPTVGIGGVTPKRVAELLESGAHGAAVLSGIWRVPSSGEAVRAYLQALSI